MDSLNLISVSETASREVIATGARMIVRISGESFFTGTQAFKKAAEVAACISSLKNCGVADDDIRLINVSAEAQSGYLTKSSSTTYDLEVKCKSIDFLAPIIAAISSQKNSKISYVAWDYPELAKVQNDVLQDAVRKANAAVNAIAGALNVAVVAVHRLSYDVAGLDTDMPLSDHHVYRRRAKAMGKGIAELTPGLTFSHTTEIAVTVKADFVVTVFSQPNK